MIVYLGRREMTESEGDFELGRQGEEGYPQVERVCKPDGRSSF